MPDAIVFHLLVLHLLLTVPHELGHYVAARLLGVAVPEFGIGLPPTIRVVRWRGTRWSLNLLPLGAFVGYSSPQTRPHPHWTAFAIAIGGSAANLLIALACLVVLLVPESVNIVDLVGNAARHLGYGFTHPLGNDELVSLSYLTIPSLKQSIGQWTTASDFLLLLFSTSLTIGIFNLLPIPSLDGGKVLFAALRAIGCGKRVERLVWRAGFAVMSVLAGLGVVLAVTVRA